MSTWPGVPCSMVNRSAYAFVARLPGTGGRDDISSIQVHSIGGNTVWGKEDQGQASNEGGYIGWHISTTGQVRERYAFLRDLLVISFSVELL